jgi:hypothetical protein
MTDSSSPGSIGRHLAVALAAGTSATKPDDAAAAIKDRFTALKRAVAKKGAKADAGGVELERHGLTKDRDAITAAKELLALIKIDEEARNAVGDAIDDVEAALVALAEIDVDDLPPSASVPVPTTSRRLLAPAEHSKTELERQALPIWQRTDRFFTKLGILVGVVVLGVVAWFALGPSPNEALEACRRGDKARCWEVVTAADAIDQGRQMPDEPLRLLCDRDQDPCACAGLAYVVAMQTEGTPGCGPLEAAAALDPRWPCTCRRYDFWRPGQQRSSHCGIPRCE